MKHQREEENSSESSSDEDSMALFSRRGARTSEKVACVSVPTAMTPTASFPEAEQWSFEALGLSPWIVQGCKSLGMGEPTAVQKACIPAALQGRGIFASAPTGSGKTAAFALPILDFLAKDPYGIFAVVLSPTRELAFQIGDQFMALGTGMRLRCAVVVGGVNHLRQQEELSRDPHVVVATPGRMAAHMRSCQPPRLIKVRVLVLDEADRMLEDSFAEDLVTIFKACPKDRQTMLYSATVTESVRKAAKSSTDLFEYHAGPQAQTPDALDERYLLVAQQVKSVYLAYLIKKLGPELVHGPLAPKAQLGKSHKKKMEDAQLTRAGLVIVFVSSCESCHIIGEMLLELGIKCSILHSALSQDRRLAALGKFRSLTTNVLVATDVASRGLDIPQVDLVINYDVPRAKEDYVHRVGRTARAGRTGVAISLVTQYDIKLVHAIEEETGKKLALLPDVDEENDVLTLLTRVTNATQTARMKISETGMEDALKLRKKRRR